jgi:hypothetical protein
MRGGLRSRKKNIVLPGTCTLESLFYDDVYFWPACERHASCVMVAEATSWECTEFLVVVINRPLLHVKMISNFTANDIQFRAGYCLPRYIPTHAGLSTSDWTHEPAHSVIWRKVLTTVVMKSFIFWDITSCNPLKVYRRFGATCRLHLKGRRISQEINQHETVASRTYWRWQVLWNVGRLSTYYMAVHPRRHSSLI